MNLNDYIEHRRNFMRTVIQNNSVADRLTYTTPSSILGVEIKEYVRELNQPAFVYGVIKNLGMLPREFALGSKQNHEDYVSAVIDVVKYTIEADQNGTLNTKTWFTEFASNRGLITDNGAGGYMWAELDYRNRFYLDLFTRYFMSWLEQYNKAVL